MFEVFESMKEIGYERREGQEDMALDIAEAMRDGENLIVEAGVGIGKSFAYLFPSILSTHFNNKPIIIASSTIHLTEQLENDVSDAVNILNKQAHCVVGKGRGNYYCEARANNLLNSKSEISSKLKDFILDYPTGQERLSKEEWEQVNVKDCKFNRCELRWQCDFYNVRQGLMGHGEQAGDVIIVNQDLLIAHYLKKEKTGRGFLNNNHDTIIIDEAHNFEEKARNALTVSFTKKDINRLILSAEGVNGKSFPHVKSTMDKFLKRLKNIFLEKSKGENERMRFFINKNHISDFESLRYEIEDIFSLLQIQDRATDDQIESFDNLVTLFDIVFNEDDSNYIYWAEVENGEISISFAPNDISAKLETLIFNREKNFILTSATLASGAEGEKYDYIKSSIGFEGQTSPNKPSPFPYNDNARLFLPENMPHYKDESHISTLAEKIFDLSVASDGRSLALFTSKEEMYSVYNIIKENEFLPFEVMVQSSNGESDTLKYFKEKKGLLLATGTYWEGLDIKGETLSQLIIGRLPFPVPDPILKYKLKTSEDSYGKVLFPEMMLKLKQGIGRLIRSNSDIGVLSILDSRLSESSDYSYKEEILQSLPIQKRVYSLDELKTFLA